MPRPCRKRWIEFCPGVEYFKPAGVPLREIQEVVLSPDEVEALRLADLEEQYQEQAAAHMKVSRPTFSRIVQSARKKMADAIINGKALRLEKLENTDRCAVSAPAGRQRRCGRGFGRRSFNQEGA